MAFSYVVSSILSIVPGMTCTLPVPWSQIGDRTGAGRNRVTWFLSAYRDGELVDSVEHEFEFVDGRMTDAEPPLYQYSAEHWSAEEAPGFIECGVRATRDEPIFSSRVPIGFYTIYTAPGRKSFFSDNAWKYASPPVIAQIAQFQRYIDAYPVVRIDKDKDAGMSLILINPYLKAVLAKLVTHDGRSLERLRVMPNSARRVNLENVLEPDERVWVGQIQISANNRLVTYVNWHSLSDPGNISDQEHLDPYRGEGTHIRASQLARREIQSFLVTVSNLTRWFLQSFARKFSAGKG